MKTRLLGLLLLVLAIASGVWLAFGNIAHYEDISSPDQNLKVFMSALKRNDISTAQTMMTPQGRLALESFPNNKEWKHSALFKKAKDWRLEKSDCIWPIMQKWASHVSGKPVAWKQYNSANEYRYPIFGDDEFIITFVWIRQRDGSWLIDRVMMIIAE